MIPALFQLFFLLTALNSHHQYTRDSQEYLNQAYNIFHHQTFYCGEPGQPVTDVSLYSRRPPGYGLFILITSLFLHIPNLTLVIQSVLSVFNLYLGYRIARLLVPSFQSPWIFALLSCALPSQFIIAATFMSEIPFQTALLLSGYYLLLYEKPEGKYRHLYAHHFLIFCAYMIKPIAGLLWVISALYIIATQNESRSVIRLAVLSFLHLLVMAAGLARNYHYTGIAEGSSIPHKVVVNYNLRILLSEVYGESRSSMLMDSLQEEMQKETYALQSAIADQFIRQQISDHPAAYLKVLTRGMLKFFIDPGRWEIVLWEQGMENADNPPSLITTYRTTGWEGVVRIAGLPQLILTFYAAVMAIVLSVMLLIWLVLRKTNKHHKLFIAGLLFYFSFMTGPSASARFKIPVYPLMITAACLLLTQKPSAEPMPENRGKM